MRRAEALAKLREILPAVRGRYGVKELSVFGSIARDEATTASDIGITLNQMRSPSRSDSRPQTIIANAAAPYGKAVSRPAWK